VTQVIIWMGVLLEFKLGNPSFFSLKRINSSSTFLSPWEQEKNIYVLTFFFVDPTKICSIGDLKGDRIWLKHNDSYDEFPLKLTSQSSWESGNCLYGMGELFFKNRSSVNQSCDTLYPVFLHYNWENVLNGFGVFVPNNFQSGIRWTHLSGFSTNFVFKNYPTCLDKVEKISIMNIFMSNPIFETVILSIILI
jgi:hypothetical protein